MNPLLKTVLKRSFFLAVPCLLVLALAQPARATWSIIVANTETGEVGIGSATCVDNINLKRSAGVIVVGKGAGQAQAASDVTAENRQTIFNGLMAGLSAPEILEELKATDPHLKSHQYGIVDLMGGAATYSSEEGAAWKGGFIGQTGPIVYAIQGNVLAGEGVILAAEEALIQTPGDLGQKLMMAMQAAKLYGGDGRCSCSESDPPGCGCPPPDFDKSAHVGYITIARIGDPDGDCTMQFGCANGKYYMRLNVTKTSDVDPVDTLQEKFDAFRDSWAGHADHILTQKTVFPKTIVADGASTAELLIAPADIDGFPIDHGGAVISVTHDENSAGAASIGPVIDHGDGTYSVKLTAGTTAGKDLYRVVIEDGMGEVTLYPFPELEVVPLTLLCDPEELSALKGTPLGFSLMGGSERAGRAYLVLGSLSGTEPGFVAQGVHVPLNFDLFTVLLFCWSFGPLFPSASGLLDVDGNAQAVFDPLPMQMVPLIGRTLYFDWVTLLPVDFASNPQSVRIVP